jgi:type I restriction enzyme S subunit
VRASSRMPLERIARVFNGKTPSREDQRDQGHPVLKIKDTDEHGRFRGEHASFVEQSFAKAHTERCIVAGDTLILNAAHNASHVASKVYRAERAVVGALATGEWLIIRPEPSQLDAGFLAHWVTWPQTRQSMQLAVKGIHLYPKDVARLEIPCPTLPEQRRIAAILDEADALRAKRRAALAQLDEMARAIFVEMFGDAHTWASRWNMRSFSDVMRDETARSSKLQQGEFLPTGRYPVVDQGQTFVAGYCDDPAYLCVSQLPCVVFGDHTRHVKLVREQFVIGADGAKVLVPQSGINAVFLAAVLRGAPIPDLGYSRHMREVKRLSFPVPPIQLQARFAERIGALEQMISIELASARAMAGLFASLQHRAFRGEL